MMITKLVLADSFNSLQNFFSVHDGQNDDTATNNEVTTLIFKNISKGLTDVEQTSKKINV